MSRRRADVAVVGAGLSGLAAAHRLERQGLSVCIVEARDRIGGRMVASDRLGAPFDAGAQFLHPNCTEMLALAARHGIATALAPTEGAMVRSFGGERRVIDDLSTLFGDAAATQAAFAALGELQAMMAALPDGAPWAAPDAAAWDAITFRDWAATRIADPVALAMFVARPTFDMALGWDNIALLAVLAHMKAGGIEKAMGVIVKVAGGVAALAAALASELTAEIMLGSPVTAIEQRENGVAVHAAGCIVDARAVVVALSPALADCIAFAPPLPRDRILLQRAWHDRPSAKTLAVYDRRWWLDCGLAGTAVGDRPAAALVLDGSIPDHPDGVLAVFSSCRDTAADPAAIVADLVHYFGDAAAAPRVVVTHDWSAEHWTGGCGSAPPPRLLSRFGPALRAPVGRVFWAGTETATVGTYNMEGAITAGYRAADEVAAAIGAAARTWQVGAMA